MSAMSAMCTGTVATFDDAVGIGSVRENESSVEYFFHCTAIADGSRTIQTGTPVRFAVIAGRRGLWEASSLAPVSSGQT